MLPADTLKTLINLVADGIPQKRIVSLPGEPPGVYGVLNAEGEIERREAMRQPQRHQAADLETLVTLADRIVADEDMQDPEFWYDRNSVVMLFAAGDAGDADGRATLDLSPSPQLALLMQWDTAGKASLTQAELVLLLRTTFAGCAPPELLGVVRQVRANKCNEVQQQIQQGRVSMARSVVAEMTGAAAVPERVTLTVRAFAQPAVPTNVNVTVEIDPDPVNERFTLVVHPGAIEAALGGAEDVIAGRLTRLLGDNAGKVPLYRGTP